jgi:pimeloyl-ACP methyl ester carboxylesterase
VDQQVVQADRRDVVVQRLEREPVVTRRQAELRRRDLFRRLDAGQVNTGVWRVAGRGAILGSTVGAVDERFTNVGDVELCYETFGDPGNPAMLLIMGLGTQMIGWREDFCRELVDRGFFVIRYDNRDSGRSTHLDSVRPPTPGQLLRRRIPNPAYTLTDMADDAAGLLGALEIEAAHVVGASMGGMIAQTLAARHPERVLSLTSIMSNTGSRWSGQAALRLWPFLLRRPKAGKEAFVERIVKVFEVIGSPGFAADHEWLREMAALSFDRGADEASSARQLAAILASGNRTAELHRITAPTLVVHGSADRLVRPSGGRATARAIPGARLLRIEGMGHDLPRGAWPQITDAIVENAARAAAPPARQPA